jgi:hypothetical protein
MSQGTGSMLLHLVRALSKLNPDPRRYLVMMSAIKLAEMPIHDGSVDPRANFTRRVKYTPQKY